MRLNKKNLCTMCYLLYNSISVGLAKFNRRAWEMSQIFQQELRSDSYFSVCRPRWGEEWVVGMRKGRSLSHRVVGMRKGRSLSHRRSFFVCVDGLVSIFHAQPEL